MLRLILNIRSNPKFWFLLLVSMAVVATMLFIGFSYSQPQDTIQVSLDRKTALPPVQEIAGDAYSGPSSNSLRVAIAGVLSPSESLETYQELLGYMGKNLGKQVTLILKPTYAEINDLIRGQRVDLAFVCSLSYVIGHNEFGMELLVAPQIRGETVYYSYLIVPKESNATSLSDLRGGTFAFTDPISNSGYLAPTYQLSLLGESPVSFFSRYIFTYSHDNSIIAIADKLVDGATVDSLVYDRMVVNDPELASETKIIARWGPYGIPPVVIDPMLDPELKQQLLDFFLRIHTLDEGRMILDDLGIDKFVVVSDDIYDSVREMQTKLGW